MVSSAKTRSPHLPFKPSLRLLTLLLNWTNWPPCLCSCPCLPLEPLPCLLVTDSYQSPVHPHRRLNPTSCILFPEPVAYVSPETRTSILLPYPAFLTIICLLITSTGTADRDSLCILVPDPEIAEENVKSKKDLLKENIFASQVQQVLLKMSYRTRKT